MLGEIAASQALMRERVRDGVSSSQSHSGVWGPPPEALDSLGALWCNRVYYLLVLNWYMTVRHTVRAFRLNFLACTVQFPSPYYTIIFP